MTILRALGSRLSGRGGPADSIAGADSKPDPGGEAPLPFGGYDRLGDRQVIAGLAGHSQIELEAVERYERAHKDRARVLDKLRYMRQPEPLPDYDSLSVDEIVAALEETDMTTVKKVRGYERKFANRPSVLDEVTRIRHRGEASPVEART